jgi:hypothetical protein
MECLRSFVIAFNNASTYSGTPTVKTWLSGTESFWAINLSGSSVFKFQGFKNVDIYGIDVIGDVGTQNAAATGGMIVGDWNFELKIDGTLPLPSGLIDTTGGNYWNIEIDTSNTKTFRLSKNTNSLKFEDPIKSAKLLEFLVLRAEGSGSQTSSTISIDYDLSFIIYYKFEGE